jgi:hypothetical protein
METKRHEGREEHKGKEYYELRVLRAFAVSGIFIYP